VSDRDKLLQSAQKWVDKKRYDRAVEDYLKVVQLDPKDMRTLLKVGDLQARMQAYDEAIATYDRVGQFYADQGFALKAIAVYKQIRELIRKHAPQLTDRYGYIVPKLAEIYTQLGLTSDALAAWDEVAARHQRNNQDRDAIEVFQKMVTLDSTNPLPYLRLAEACCRVQELEDAIQAFWTAAELLLKLDRREDALKVIERILHFKQDPTYARAAAQLYLARGRREDGMQALAKLQIAFQADPRDIDTLSLLAQAFTLIEQAEKAIEVYKEMARIARESERGDLYQELVAHLAQVAPHDEGVQALMSAPPPAAPQVEPSAVHVDDADVELVEEADAEPEYVEEVVEERYVADSYAEISDVEDQTDAVSGEAPFNLYRASAPDVVVEAADVVIVDSQVEAAEELDEGGDFDAAAHIHKALVDSEAFRRLRLYSKALETLQIALEIDPTSIDVREKLRELLIESGDRDAAIGESITLAAIYMDRGDTAQAENLLYEVVEVEPQHPAALEMLAQIQGGSMPGAAWSADGPTETVSPDYQAYMESQPSIEEQQGYQAVPPSYDEYHARGPLPSYDLEEVGASSALASPYALEPPAGYTDDGFSEMDDPFSTSSPQAAAPLPSFPLGTEEVEEIEPEYIDAEPEYIDAEPEYVEPDAAVLADEGDFADQTAAEPIPFDEGQPTTVGDDPAHARELIEEALEEAEFFASRGLYDDAKTIITDQLSRSPGHPLLRERLREIEHIIAASVESVTIDRSQLGGSIVDAAPPDNAYDIAASLEALDSLEPAGQAPAPPSSAADLDVESVFQTFKSRIKAQVSENDSATHYDLGVAYKEMGLLEDAMHEFELAARDPSRECMCFAMIGMIRLEMGELDKAQQAYSRGLEAPQRTVDQEMALYYDLGNVCEMKSNSKDALYYFQLIARKDPRYRDVSDRIAALVPGSAPVSTARAVNDEEDFDEVFDDLFESK